MTDAEQGLVRVLKPWTEIECDQCGDPHLASRTEPREVAEGEEILCAFCDGFARGRECMRDERDAALARAEAAEREAERLRHGFGVEGDWVCPNDLRADEAERELAVVVEDAKADRNARDEARAYLRSFIGPLLYLSPEHIQRLRRVAYGEETNP